MIELAGLCAVSDSEFVIEYEGTNKAREPIFVAHLPTDARSRVYPNNAYCALSPDMRHANLVVGESPLPYDRDVEFGVAAFSMKVPKSGFRGFVAGEIRLTAPLREWDAYFPPHEDDQDELVLVKRVVLHVDVVPLSMTTWIRQARTAPDYWSVGGSWTRYSLEFPLVTPLPICKRHDYFPRP